MDFDFVENNCTVDSITLKTMAKAEEYSQKGRSRPASNKFGVDVCGIFRDKG